MLRIPLARKLGASGSTTGRVTSNVDPSGSSSSFGRLSLAVAAASVVTVAAYARRGNVNKGGDITNTRRSSMRIPYPYLFANLLHTSNATYCESPPAAVNLRTRMTSIGYFSLLSETQSNPSIVTFFMTLKNTPQQPQFGVNEFIQLWNDKNMSEKHPRFHHSVSPTHAGYFQHCNSSEIKQQQNQQDDVVVVVDNPAQKETVDQTDDGPKDAVQDHVFESLYPQPEVVRQDILRRIRTLQLQGWDLSSQLWSMSIASPENCSRFSYSLKDNAESSSSIAKSNHEKPSYLFFRGHHALADGASMGAVLLELCDEAEEYAALIVDFLKNQKKKRKGLLKRLFRQFKVFLWLFFGTIKALFYQFVLRLDYLFSSNPWAQLAYINADNTPDRVVSYSLVAPIDQIKWVGKTVGGKKTTVNDVMMACVNAAMTRLLDHHRTSIGSLVDSINVADSQGNKTAKRVYKKLSKNGIMHIASPVHLRGGVVLPGESVGNRLGALVVRLPSNSKLSSEDRLKAVNREMTYIKQTPTAILGHVLARGIGTLAPILPKSWVAGMFASASAGSCCVVTNVRGPNKLVHWAGRTVENMYGFVPLPPGIPVGVVVQGYAGNVSITISAQPWAVPDADLFASWILEEYMNLVEIAKNKSSV